MAKRAKKAAGAVIDTSKYGYETQRIRDKDGKILYSTGKGDAISKAMLLHKAAGGTTEQIVKANKLGLEIGNRNAGQFRMSVANVLRAKVRGGEHVQIGDVTVKSLDTRVAMPEVKAKATGERPARKAKSAAKTPRKARKPRAPKVVEEAEQEAA